MNIKSFFKLIKQYFGMALLSGMLLGAFSFLFLVTTQKNFRSSADVLISQNQVGADYYSLSQSANYLTNILTQSMYGEKFLNEVNTKSKVLNPILKGDRAKKIKKWRHIIQIKNDSHLGIMHIEIFGDTQNQTKIIAQDVLDILVNRNSFFLGQDRNITVSVLSGPIIEKNPSSLQIVVTSMGGFLVGVLLFVLFLVYKKEYEKQSIAEIEFKQASTSSQNEDNLANNIYPIEENLTEEDNQADKYLSADSDYWKKRLQEDYHKF